MIYSFTYSFYIVWKNMRAHKNLASWVSLKWVKSNEQRRKREERKSVLAMASYTGGTRKPYVNHNQGPSYHTQLGIYM